MSLRFLVLIACTFATPSLSAEEYPPPTPNWMGKSPDGMHVAVTREIPDKTILWRQDLDTGAIEIIDVQNDTAVWHVRYDIWRLNRKAGWSPDSQFLVMTTDSAGGHSPWHFESFVYSVKDQKLRQMDPIIGSVVRPTFTFSSPHTVRMAVMGPNGNFDSPLWVEVDLEKKDSFMPEVGDRKAGRLNTPFLAPQF